MTTKEKIKKELDTLPEEFLKKVYEFLHSLKPQKRKQRSLKSFHLKGKFDSLNIRKESYE